MVESITISKTSFMNMISSILLMISILLFSLASNSGNDFNSSLLYYWKWLNMAKKIVSVGPYEQ